MKNLFSLNGIVTTVLTPFTLSLEIDWVSFRRSICAALDSGVSDFLVPCLANELKYLTVEERFRVASGTLKIVRGALVIPNIMGYTREERMYSAEIIYSLVYKRCTGQRSMNEDFHRGVHALMPSRLYELFVNVYDIYHKKSREAAMHLFFDMLIIMVFTRQSDAVNCVVHKTYLPRLGICETTFCRDGNTFDKYHNHYANKLIDYAIDLREKLPLYWKRNFYN